MKKTYKEDKDIIIGREQEKLQLKKSFSSDEAEFISLYGRRRVGKTFLINNLLKSQSISNITITGLKDGDIHSQLSIFTRALEKAINSKFNINIPRSWIEAFDLLTIAIEEKYKNTKFVIFLDELPWLATAKSGLMQALDHIWNTNWSYNKNIKLIVCGSAASWMIDNIINSKGGLHNRITKILPLKAFTLSETKKYLESKKIKLNNKQILDLYMVMGGVPFYLRSVEKGLSAVQNINNICFTEQGILFNEFNRLYISLFENSDIYLEIMKVLAKNRIGLNKESLVKKLKLSSSGGTLKKRLDELEEAGFIVSFLPIGNRNKGIYYKIIDEYSYFYLTWIKPVEKRIKLALNQTNYWHSKSQTQNFRVWSGYAFESVCYKHIEYIISLLEINVGYEISSWSYIPSRKKTMNKNLQTEKGTQIDLIIDRADGIINICEIKYCEKKYQITKKYFGELCDKIEIFKEKVKTNKQVFLTMITVNGILDNLYSDEIVDQKISLIDFM